MEYYLSDYTRDRESNLVPRVAQGSFTSIHIQDKAIVALPGRSDGPGRTHIASHAKDRSLTPSRLLGRVFKADLIGDSLAVVLAELLMKHTSPGLRPYSPPVAWTAVHGPHNEIKYLREYKENHGQRWQIWLGNECIWSMPCIQGGLVRSDNFNRVDEHPLTTGDRWVSITGWDLPNLIRTTPNDSTTGVIQGRNMGASDQRFYAAAWNVAHTPFTGNHAAEISTSGAHYAVVAAATRADVSVSGAFYECQYWQNVPALDNQKLQLVKRAPGVATVLAEQAPITSDTFPLGSGSVRLESSGSTHICSFRGTGYTEMTPILTVTDTSYTGGVPGFFLYTRGTGALGGPGDQHADNFFADGDVEGAQFGTPLDC